MIFAYGYGCCVFKHNICGDRPEVLEGMPDFTDPLSPKFFVNPGCPLVQAASKATTIEVPLNKASKDRVEIAAAKDHGRLLFLSLYSYLITTFCKEALVGRHHLCTLWASLVLQ